MPAYNDIKPAIPFPKDQLTPVETPVKVVSDEYRGRLIDTAYMPMQNILLNIEGTRWTVDYFSQVLNTDNAVSFGGPGKDDTYMQYRLIKDFELRVTNPLTQTQETTDKTMNLTGSSNVYPCLVPNVGDVFIADIGDGRKAVFQISHVERLSVRKNSAFSIEYEAVNYADGEVGTKRYEDTLSKTIETVHFDRDFVVHGQNPFLLTEEFNVIKELRKVFNELASDWANRYISKEYRTLLVPKQAAPVYDHFVNKAAHSILSAENTSWRLLEARVLNFSREPQMSVRTLWDLFINRTERFRDEIATKVGLVKKTRFHADPLYNSFRWVGIEYAVYPVDGRLPVDDDYKSNPKVVEGVLQSGQVLEDLLHDSKLDEFSVYEDLDVDYNLPWIYPSTQDGYYVLSKSFYEGLPVAASVLEHQARAYLRHEALDPAKILALARNHHKWTRVDQFYQTLILLILIIAVTRGY